MADEIIAAEKVCRRCASEFTGKQCKVCANRRAAAYRNANREKVRAANERWKHSGAERTCPKCQSSYFGTTAYCSSCNKRYKAEYFQRNREKILAACALRVRNPEKERRRYQKYYRENASEIAKRGAVYRAANREKVRAARMAWAGNNADRLKAMQLAWAKANPEKARTYAHNRRARKRENGGKLSPNLAEKLFALQRGKCACCGKRLGKNYHMDHIVPLALGGPNVDSNMQLLTSSCNQRKHAKDPIRFMQERGFLL